MNVERIIHPIGQGAFYTEKFTLCNKIEFNVVFDCGTKSKKKYLEAEIDNRFNNNSIIDILFISHFDADHVSGIDYLINTKKCIIKKVIIPLIDKSLQSFYICKLLLDNINPRILTETQQYFGNDTVIITVDAEFNTDGSDNNNIPVTDLRSGIIKNGTKLNYFNWVFVPFNYEETTRSASLMAEFSKYGIDISKINDPAYINNNKKTIKKCYKNIPLKDAINITSLILFSGTNMKSSFCFRCSSYNCFEKCECCRACCCYCCDDPCVFENSCFPSCLYLGDTDLNQTSIINDLSVHLNDLKGSIGMIQIPHHGSHDNFNSAILDINRKRKLCFISHNYMYKHPSASVVNYISARSYICHQTTVDIKTKLQITFHI